MRCYSSFKNEVQDEKDNADFIYCAAAHRLWMH